MNSPIHLKEEKTPRSHESIFLEHYDWLLDRAGHLVAGTPEDPKELVQELYIHFVQLKVTPDFHDHAHIQGYLRKALKNLFASRRMRHGRDATTRLTLVDFDSLETALAAVDRSQLLNVRSDLARISEYILLRRPTNKGATVFIMRFFFDYLPSEIQQILKLNRKHFERMLRATRLEAKAYVERPHVLRLLDRRDRNAPSFPSTLPEDTAGLFAELQRRMLFEQVGDHRLLRNVEEIYTVSGGPLSIEQTAHLGSCRFCLHQAGQFLNIPDLILQLFPDAAEPGDPTSGSRGIESDRLKKLRRKGRENFEHRPSQLQIIVDGQLRGVQAITSAESRLQLTLKPLSRPEFVEIRSEQGVSLLYFDLQSGGDLLLECEMHAEFSESRTLAVGFRIVDGAPTLNVRYLDPLWEYAEETMPATGVLSEASHVQETFVPKQPGVSWMKLLRTSLRNLQSFVRRRRGGTAALAISLIAAALFLHHTRTPVLVAPLPSAQELITNSQQHTAAAIPDGGGTRAVYRLDRHIGGNTSHISERVEVLRSKSAEKSDFRLLSPSGTVIDDRRGDEERRMRQSGHVTPRSESRRADAPSPAWTHVPDIRDFLLIAGGETISVSRTAFGFDLAFHRDAAAVDGIVEGHIGLSGPNLHPIGEDLRVQDSDSASTYTFAEVQYSILSPAEFHRFDLETDRDSGSGRHSQQVKLVSSASLALHALKMVGEYSGAEDTIDLERSPKDEVRLSGVLPSDREARELIRKLRSLAGGERLILDIHSSNEVAKNQVFSARIQSVQTTSIESVQQPVPWIELLRSASSRGTPLSSAERDTASQQAKHLVEDGALIHREVWLTAGLASRWFKVSDLRSLSLQDKQLWASLVLMHLRAANNALQDVANLLDVQTMGSPVPFTQITDVDSFAAAVDRLEHDGERLDRLLSSGFALSSTPPTADSSEIYPLLTALDQQESRLMHVAESLH